MGGMVTLLALAVSISVFGETCFVVVSVFLLVSVCFGFCLFRFSFGFSKNTYVDQFYFFTEILWKSIVFLCSRGGYRRASRWRATNILRSGQIKLLPYPRMWYDGAKVRSVMNYEVANTCKQVLQKLDIQATIVPIITPPLHHCIEPVIRGEVTQFGLKVGNKVYSGRGRPRTA